jgi:predicted amidohydrolase
VIKAASIQLYHDDKDTDQDRVNRADQLVESASDYDLIVLPELWYAGVWSYDSYWQSSQTVDGEIISRFAEKAKKLNAYILAGSIIEREGDSLYNTAILLDPRGKTLASYRKMHLVGAFGSREPEYMKPGDKLIVVKTDLGILGLSICYDLRFPEFFRKLAVNHGVEIFLHATAWPLARLDDYRATCHVRANENQCFMISSDMSGFNRGNPFAGHSAIIDPWGKRVASAGIYEKVVKAEIDLDEVYQARKMLPLLKDRKLPV